MPAPPAGAGNAQPQSRQLGHPGFKEALANTEAFPIRGPGFASRVDALHVDAGFNRTPGAQHITGKTAGPGAAERHLAGGAGQRWQRGVARPCRSPQWPAGDLRRRTVLDDNNNPIAIPPYQAMEIGADGTISIIPQGEGPQTMAQIGRIKVVQAPDERLERGLDGLFRNTDPQQPFAPAQGTAVHSGQLEGSNVDAAGHWCR